MNRELSCYCSIEVMTDIGQVINVECPPDEVEIVKEFFEKHKLRIKIPETKKVSNADHGCYRSYSRYDIVQHKYGARDHDEGSYFVEVLEIKDALNNKGKFIIYCYSCSAYYLKDNESFFQEWDTLENAIYAFENGYYSIRNNKVREELDKDPKFFKKLGLKRTVNCSYLTPWFYAVGNQEIIEDYAFPDNLQLNDPVFTFGKKFVVYDKENVPEIKMCMGAILSSHLYDDQKNIPYRLVCFNDGSVWNDKDESTKPPRPLMEDESWIVEAYKQFILLISEKNNKFSINFIDGYVFKGSLTSPKNISKKYCKEGRYELVVVYFKNQSSVSTCKKQGWVDFVPTLKCPDINSYIKNEIESNGGLFVNLKVSKFKGNEDSIIFFKK